MLSSQVRPFSELPQRPIHGMLNFWQTKEGLHAIETDATLRPCPVVLHEDPEQQEVPSEVLPESVTEAAEAMPDLDATALPVLIEAGA